MLFWFWEGKFLKDKIEPPLNERFRSIGLCKIFKHYLVFDTVQICIVLCIWCAVAIDHIFPQKTEIK